VELAGAAGDEDTARPRVDSLGDVLRQPVGIHIPRFGEWGDGKEQDAIKGGVH
jgi:hypothetical protein